MMKIYYLSTTSFSDCDINLLHHMHGVQIAYGVIFPHTNTNFTEKELSSYCDTNNIIFDSFIMKFRFRDPRVLFIYIKIIRSIISFKPDVIYINNFDQIYFNILLATAFSKSKIIIGLHDVIDHSGTSFSIIGNISKYILISKFHNFLTFSDNQANFLKLKWKNKDVKMIPLMLKNFGYSKKSTKGEYVNFLFFGNIKRYKGLDVLLQSVNRLSFIYKNFTLTIAGRCQNWDSDYAHYVKDLNNIETHIRFIENHEIPAFFSKANYLVLPYLDATQSGPLMIAYNYNVPVIASNIDGFKEFIDGSKTGFLFDPKVSDDLDFILEKAILGGEDLYNKLSKGVSDYVNKNLAPAVIAKQYKQLFVSKMNG